MQGFDATSGPKDCPERTCFSVDIIPKGEPHEIGWQIVDSKYLPIGNGVGQPSGSYTAPRMYREEICLIAGEYFFVALSSQADGWNGGRSLPILAPCPPPPGMYQNG